MTTRRITKVNSMVGHNSGNTLLNLNVAISDLNDALVTARAHKKNTRDDLVKIARALAEVDERAGGDEYLADQRIKAAGILFSTDILASAHERAIARWMARGGVKKGNLPQQQKTPNEINDLEGSPNAIEVVLGEKRFDKINTFAGVYSRIRSDVLTDIRAIMNNKEPRNFKELDDLRVTHGDRLFEMETIDSWIAEEQYKRTEEYKHRQDLKAAWAMKIDEEIELAGDDALKRLGDYVKKQLEKIYTAQAQRREEAAQKEATTKIPAKFRRALETSSGNEIQEMTDEDF